MVIERLQQQGRSRGGTWGEWSAWTPCSRTCGGGVSIQSRECLMKPRRDRVRTRRRATTTFSGSGSRCVGLYKRFQLCNTQACGAGYTDIRREQCASFNKTPFNRRFYTWEPYYDTPDSCALNCRAVGLSFYATLNQTVIDGTPCSLPNTNRICVAGRCMGVGCDGVLGSGLKFDTCGECGGDNSTCRVIGGIFSRVTMPYGYNLIATLPGGAANLTIQHVSPSVNFLALRQQGGDFFLNGNWAANVSGHYQFTGTTFTYKRPDSYMGDKVIATGPLHHPVDVLLFYQSTNPGIKYEYRLPMSASSSQRLAGVVTAASSQRPRRPVNPLNPLVPGGPASRTTPTGPVNDARSLNGHNSILTSRRWKDKKEEKKKRKKERKGKKNNHAARTGRKGKKNRYEWNVVGFSSCSETCGGGTQTTRVVCVKRKRGNEAPSRYCHGLLRPTQETVRCNLRPCPPSWEAGEWGPCSVTCGLGVQTRTLSCKMRLSPDNSVPQPEGACLSPAHITKAQVCERPSCDAPPEWEPGEWGECSAQCGLGTRHRDVTCAAAQGRVEDSECDARNKASNQELCDMGSCATDTWFFSGWEDSCSEQCGDGVQRRRVHCSGDALDNQVTESSCDPEQQPGSTRVCTSDRGCGGKWFTGPWGECSAECGSGRQSRPVVCVVFRGRWRITTDTAQCKGHPQPDSSQACTRTCGYEWYTSEWSQCSESCGSGVQRREVKCLDEAQKPALGCTSATKPDTRQTCNTQSCHQEQADESVITAPSSNQVPQRPSNLSAAAELKSSGSCMDRMKNCHLVFKARLCRLKYYNKLCCETCTTKQ